MRRSLAEGIVASLLDWDVHARVRIVAPCWFDVRVALDRSTEAVWDIGNPWGLGAQIRKHGVLIGLVPVIPGSETGLTVTELALMIARSDGFVDVRDLRYPCYPVKTFARS